MHLFLGVLRLTQPAPSLNNLVGQIHTFEVAITYMRPIHALLYNLSWFYNDELIANSTDSLITNDGASLTTTLQEGVYEARYEDSLYFLITATANLTLQKY